MEPGDNPNPIVAMAMKIRARKDIESAIDSGTPAVDRPVTPDAAAALAAFGDALAIGARRLNSILASSAMTYVRLERPLRIRLRYAGKRITFDLDTVRELVVVRGCDFDGDYQFDTGASVPALINLSKLSTDADYGEALTPNVALKRIAEESELPRPPHLDGLGPLVL
ncbi:MAG: hypothetical protein NVS2B8_12070 [Vulcanimicrobiaceae bacterium]